MPGVVSPSTSSAPMTLDLQTVRTARFAYPLGLLLFLAPLLELAGRVWPLQWYLAQWRFQTELALVNASPVLMLGALVIIAVAWMSEDIGVLKLSGLLLVTFGVLLLPTLVMLGLDGMQLQSMARAELRGTFRNNVVLSALRALLGCAASLSLGIAALRLARHVDLLSSPRSHKVGSEASPTAAREKREGLLVVGREE